MLVRPVPPPPGAQATEARFATLRLIAAGLGLVILVGGVFLAFVLFRGIVAAIDQPEPFKERLDRWEKVVGGDGIFLEWPREGTVPSARRGAGERVAINVARPLAAVLLVVVVWLLVRIAFSMIAAGGRLVHLASPHRELLKNVLREVGTSRPAGPDSPDA